MKTNLKFNAMSILMAELQEAQMWAIYQISLGQDMPNSVTKNDLTMIIKFLFKQLDWIEKEKPSSEPKDILDAETNVHSFYQSKDTSLTEQEPLHLADIYSSNEHQEDQASVRCAENSEACENDQINDKVDIIWELIDIISHLISRF